MARGILAKSPSLRYSGLPHVFEKGTSIQPDMTAPRPCLAQLSRFCISSNLRVGLVPFPPGFQPRFLAPYATAKNNSARGQNPQKNKKKGEASKKKRKPKTTYTQYDLKDAEQFSLCDAMRYASCRSRFSNHP